MNIIDHTPPPSEVKSVSIFNQDVVIKSNFLNSRSPRFASSRGKVTKLSDKSRSRLVFRCRNTLDCTGMLTLTYPHEKYAAEAKGGDYMQCGKVVKYHLKLINKLLAYHDYCGLWVLEFQKRGAPHFHIFLNQPLSPGHAEKVARRWNEIVGASCPHHRTRGTKSETLRKRHAAANYAAKYTSKPEQKTVPEQYSDVGRFWGTFGKLPSANPPETKLTSLREVIEIARFARRAEQAHRRALGLPKRRNHRHLSGTRYNIAPTLLAYVRRIYSHRDIPPQTALLARGSPTPG